MVKKKLAFSGNCVMQQQYNIKPTKYLNLGFLVESTAGF